MTSEFETLHERVEACRRHLTTAKLSAEVRDELLQLLTDLEVRLANSVAASPSPSSPAATPAEQRTPPSPIERLRDLERSVEVEHPVLCGLVGNLADALSRIGV